jgi:imidazolonepropionase-like amidohydrolase
MAREMFMRLMAFWVAGVLALPITGFAQDNRVVIKADTVLDGKGGTLSNTSIVVEGSRISKIDPTAQGVTYDLRGLTVMPGWIDTHAHIVQHFDRKTGKTPRRGDETPQQSALYAVENAYLTLLGGFTTVQSPGAELDKDLRDSIAEGNVPGPRILSSFRAITDKTGTPDQIRAFVRQAVADGADFIKLFATSSIRDGGAQTMTDEQIQAACSEAHAAGKRAMAHAQGPEGAKAAILAGCSSIEHGNRLTDEVLDLMAQRKVYFDPNFGLLLHNYLENRAKFIGGNFNEAGFTFMEKGIPIGIDTFKRALARNIPIVFGTDAVAGANGRNYEEFVYRVRDGGQKPMAALVAANSTAAQSIGLGDRIGTIAPGFEADIIATDGNPLQDITAVRRVVFVMKGGKVYKNRATLHSAGGKRPSAGAAGPQ